MNIHIITHGDKHGGLNPSLTPDGRKQILDLSLPGDISLIVAGTGSRHSDMLLIYANRIDGIPVKFSPLCGSADSGEKTESNFRVRLADGSTVEAGNYIGLIGTPGIDLVAWMKSLPDNTLLLAGREFLGGIGFKGGEPGRLYRFDGESVRLVQ